jgi:hypothetical protein
MNDAGPLVALIAVVPDGIRLLAYNLSHKPLAIGLLCFEA